MLCILKTPKFVLISYPVKQSLNVSKKTNFMKYQFFLFFICSLFLINNAEANNSKNNPECTQTRSYTTPVVEDCGNGLTVTTSFTSTQTATAATCEAAASNALVSAQTVSRSAAVGFVIMMTVQNISNCP